MNKHYLVSLATLLISLVSLVLVGLLVAKASSYLHPVVKVVDRVVVVTPTATPSAALKKPALK